MAPELPTIDLQTLTSVTGGVTQAASDPNAQVVLMLQDLMSSIQTLAQNQNNGGGDFMQMLPMMMMMMNRSSAQAAPAPETPVGQVTPDGWTRVS
jgi:hypothetical protein